MAAEPGNGEAKGDKRTGIVITPEKLKEVSNLLPPSTPIKNIADLFPRSLTILDGYKAEQKGTPVNLNSTGNKAKRELQLEGSQ